MTGRHFHATRFNARSRRRASVVSLTETTKERIFGGNLLVSIFIGLVYNESNKTTQATRKRASNRKRKRQARKRKRKQSKQ